jgi:hypothetical protein
MTRPLDRCQLVPGNAGFPLPERIKLFQEHGLDLVFRPPGLPKVFILNEKIYRIVFIDVENYSCCHGFTNSGFGDCVSFLVYAILNSGTAGS